MHCLLTSVCPSSVWPSVVWLVVIFRKLWKIDPLLQWNSIRKLVSLILFLHSPICVACWGDALVSHKTICSDFNMASYPSLALDQLSTKLDWHLITDVVNWVRPLEPVVNNRCWLRWHSLWYDAKVEQAAGQLLFWVAMSLFFYVAMCLASQCNGKATYQMSLTWARMPC